MAKRRNNRLIIGLVALIGILIAVAVWKNKNAPKGETVNVEKVQKRTIRETVSASGKVYPEVEVKISSDVSGEIVELLVEEGDTVRKGQLLAKVNPETYIPSIERGQAGLSGAKAQSSQVRAAIENALANQQQMETQASYARTVLARNEQLLKEGVISQADFDNSSNNLKSAEANLRAAISSVSSANDNARAADFSVQGNEASLKELRTSLKRTAIYAPMDGIVTKLNIEKGDRVLGTIQMAGTEIMRIANMSKIEVQVDVSESDIPRISIGDVAEIDVDAYSNRKFRGHIMQIANTASGGATASLTNDQVTNFAVKIRIDANSYSDLLGKNKKHPFRPGMSAAVQIFTNTADNVLSVPIMAVTTRDREKKVSTPGEEGSQGLQRVEKETMLDKVKEVVFVASADSVRMVEVKTAIQDDQYIQITEGLQEGEEIVIGPYDAVSRKLKQGSKINKEDLEKKRKEREKEKN
jgi:HlyD family secretion protein